jgi:hypothetical protein
MSPNASNNTNTSTNSSNESPIQVMLRCDVCGHLVPEQNMEIHKVQRACRQSAQQQQQQQQHQDLPSLPQTPMQPQHRQQHHQPARPVGSAGNANLFGATAPFDSDDDWFQFQSRPLESNSYRNRSSDPPTAIASPVHPRSDETNNATAPMNMEWSSQDEPETFLPTGQPVRAMSRVPMDADGDDDEQKKRAARRESTGSVLQVGDVVDLVNSGGRATVGVARGSSSANDGVEIMEDADVEQQWPCPRCTLHNPGSTSVCEACNYSRQVVAGIDTSTTSSSSNHASAYASASANDGVRAADPVRRDRLVQDPFVDESQQNQQEQDQPSYMTSGALLGGVLGVAGAYLRGRPLGSAALHGAMNGAIGGAVLQEFVPSRTPPRDNRQRNNNSSRAANANVPPAAAAASASAATPDFSSPQQYRVMRNRDRNGRVTTTVYTSSSSSSSNMGTLGGGAGAGAGRNRRGNGRHFAGAGQGQEDPMLAYIMQAMANSPGGRFDMGGMGMGAMGGGDVDGMSYEQLLQRFGDGSENRGADEGTIRSLPSAAVHDPNKLPEDCRDCCICLEAFEAGGMRKTLPCLHGFHETCIDKWLRTNGACPICKHHIGH